MSTRDHEAFMRLALEEARRGRNEGNIAVGAVIVRGDQVLAKGHNQAISTFDVTAHAETVAVRKLSIDLRLHNPSSRADAGPLAGTTLYTTVEPCPMCCWATCIGGVSTLVIGARFADMGHGYGRYAIEMLIEMTGQPIALVSGILAGECAALRLGRSQN